jgi:fatty acyl-CoA reductase
VNAPRHGSGEIREKVYPIQFDAFTMTDKIVAMTIEEADLATPHLIGNHPNTYTFTKCIAEHILMEEKGDLPYAIVRPSIIGGAYAEPLEGWVDSYIGPAGLSLAAGLGAMRVMRGSARNHLDLVPVDLVANCLLATSYHTAVNPPGKRLPIYHIATGSKNPCNWETLRGSVLGNFARKPSRRQVGYPMALFVNQPILENVAHQVFHVVPAALGDAKRVVTGKQPEYLRKTAQLRAVINSLTYFTTHEWNFGVHNLTSMYESLNPTDAELFNFDVSVRYVDWEIFYVRFCNGMRKYLLKEISPEERQWVIQSKL